MAIYLDVCGQRNHEEFAQTDIPASLQPWDSQSHRQLKRVNENNNTVRM